MNRKLSKYQKLIISRLIDKYESSKTYDGSAKLAQRFFVRAEDFIDDYHSDFADVDKIKDFDEQVELLADEGYVYTQRQADSLYKIYANVGDDGWHRLYAAVNRSDKNDIRQRKLAILADIGASSDVARNFLSREKDKLTLSKNITCDTDEIANIAKLLDFIVANKIDILERELSIELLHDSKAFEKKYRKKICKILGDLNSCQSSDEVDTLGIMPSDSEREHMLLEEHGIYANPSYVYLKGDGQIGLDDGRSIMLFRDVPIALTNETIARMRDIKICASSIMTVENLTSFNRMMTQEYFYIYLGGYHNRVRREFLRLSYKENSGKRWLHFGDIDPDGYYIYEHLRSATDIPFGTFMMDVETLEKYSEYTKPLEKNDITKAKNMIASDMHTDIMRYMLETGRKLEQEIVSWKMASHI